jgi:hypothetical protein
LDDVDRPTVLVEIPTTAYQEIEQAIVKQTRGKRLRGVVIIAETDAGELGIAAPDWISPQILTDMLKDAHHSVTCNGGCGHCG